MKSTSLRRVNQLLWLFILSVVILYVGRHVLIPLVFGILFALLLAPVCRTLDEKGLKRGLSVAMCLGILLLVLAFVVAIMGIQIGQIGQDLPQIQQKFNRLLENLQATVQEHFDLSPHKQLSFVKAQAQTIAKSAGGLYKGILSGFTGLVGGLLLTLVYTFLLLFHQEKYENFLLRLYRGDHPLEARKVMGEVGKVARHYLTGRLLSILILTALYAIGLMIVGVKNALLLGGMAALMTVVPFIGAIVGGLMAVLMALVSEDTIQPALGAAGVVLFIQIIDEYFIEPYVIGGEVNLSALTTIVSLVVGEAIWGIAGMILFIPLVAILKIIFDHAEGLQAYGYLLGDQQGSQDTKAKDRFRGWFRKMTGHKRP
jgi:predicted PurR-regulated permease PerM